MNSLTKLFNDPSLMFDEERLRRLTKEVEKDKNDIEKSAEEYNNRHRDEIKEGTLKRQLMIEDGAKKGLSEKDVCKGSFVPTVRTPILNWLFFMIKEEGIDVEHEKLRQMYNEQYGHLVDDYEYKDSGVMEEPNELDSFIYGNMTHDVYKKIKKLKRLSKSDNENEAFLAYTLCMQMCKKYGLEFDKINV